MSSILAPSIKSIHAFMRLDTFFPGNGPSNTYFAYARERFETWLIGIRMSINKLNKMKIKMEIQEGRRCYYFVLPTSNNKEQIMRESLSLNEEDANIWLFLKKRDINRRYGQVEGHLKVFDEANTMVRENPQIKSKKRVSFFDTVVQDVVSVRDENNYPYLCELWEEIDWQYDVERKSRKRKKREEQEEEEPKPLVTGAIIAYLHPLDSCRGWYPYVCRVCFFFFFML